MFLGKPICKHTGCGSNSEFKGEIFFQPKNSQFARSWRNTFSHWEDVKKQFHRVLLWWLGAGENIIHLLLGDLSDNSIRTVPLNFSDSCT